MTAWVIVSFAAAAYCLARGIVDLRQRRFAWGALGIVSGILIMTVPIQTHAVKYDLPPPANAQN
jgi:hypothetical protein